MKLKVLRDLKIADGITIVSSLPDMGRVGGLVSSFVADFLKAEAVAEITSVEKPWVSYSDGVVKSVVDTYRVSYSSNHKMLILTGESQPQDQRELYSICNGLLDYAQSIGKIRRLYGAGGYLREQLTGAPRVCGVVNRPGLKQVIEAAGIEPVGNEIATITWFNGIILGQAAERDIDAIGLFGEISETSVPQPLAAKSIVSALARLEHLEIDTKPLDRHYESILEEVQKKKEPSSFGPGIG
ncbi:MAG TPA: PAC2 family protein [Nitrososphaera sp.]|nr:PAC2 family protein [Nitrososphaera sp.]